MWYQGLINFVYFNLNIISIVIGILIVVFGIVSIIASVKQESARLDKGNINIKKLGDDYKELKDIVIENTLEPTEYKKYIKNKNKQLKKDSKKNKNQESKDKSKVFVLSFKGDVNASQAQNLREEVTTILSIAKQTDKVIVRIDSPGGVVNGYGFATAQLERIKQKNIPLVVCIDEIAASGGYMMSAVADKIISSPFAIVGSIGVVGSVPNIHDLLKKHGVRVEQHTSGQYKRTLTLTGENSEEGREKFKQDLHNIHKLFKNHIATYRPTLDMEKVSTGEYWFGKDALELGLVDEIKTYDDYIIEYFEKNIDVYQITYNKKKEKSGLISKLLMVKNSIINLFHQKFF